MIVYDRLFKGRPEMIELLEEARASAQISRLIYAMRAGAGLTQAQLARRIGSTASVISRLEDDDYEGQSLAMIRRIAEAVGMAVEMRVVTAKRKRAA